MFAVFQMRRFANRYSCSTLGISICAMALLSAAAVSSEAIAQSQPAPAASAPAVEPAAADSAAQNQSGYRINPGDEVEIYVWGETRLQRPIRVLPDGTISFPLAGQIAVAGLQTRDVEKLVTARLSNQYRGEVPNVTVSVINPAGMQFSVMGRVRSPGNFTTGRYANVLNALSMAGGPIEFANLDNIQIIRQEGNRIVVIKTKIASLFKGNATQSEIDRRNIIQLLPGDVVIVP
jgi:polysaccharide biosynthesis/export protein